MPASEFLQISNEIISVIIYSLQWLILVYFSHYNFDGDCASNTPKFLKFKKACKNHAKINRNSAFKTNHKTTFSRQPDGNKINQNPQTKSDKQAPHMHLDPGMNPTKCDQAPVRRPDSIVFVDVFEILLGSQYRTGTFLIESLWVCIVFRACNAWFFW